MGIWLVLKRKKKKGFGKIINKCSYINKRNYALDLWQINEALCEFVQRKMELK